MSRKTVPHSIEIFETLSHASSLLHPEAMDAIGGYIRSQLCADGGFADRNGDSDLYYTMFGLSCAAALNLKIPCEQTAKFLDPFQPEALDLIHLNCLIKCRAAINLLRNPALASIAGRFAALRNLSVDSAAKTAVKRLLNADDGSSAYDWFLRLNAAQDCGLKPPWNSKAMESLEACRKPGGGFSNHAEITTPALNATVAAILFKRQLTGESDVPALNWLAGQIASSGGFKAAPETPLPDLMSTATALFTLKVCGRQTDATRQLSRGFIFDHWRESGGFSGNIIDNCCDCEYTFYGLLAAGAIT